MNEFEQKLSRQPLRGIPGEWRGKIIAGAMSREPNVEGRGQKDFRFSTLASRLSSLLWPHPKAWAGLAAIWIFIFVLNFSIRDKTPGLAEKISPPSPEVIAELRQQQRLFAELIGANETHFADRQKVFSPKPQSEFVEILTA